jgi:hypothetical protein
MSARKRAVLRWVLLAVGAASLSGGVAYAMQGQCRHCEPCGCSGDGGYILCCEWYGC